MAELGLKTDYKAAGFLFRYLNSLKFRIIEMFLLDKHYKFSLEKVVRSYRLKLMSYSCFETNF